MDPIREYALTMTRRHFFASSGVSLGALVLASLMPEKVLAQDAAQRAVYPDCPISSRERNVRFFCL
jgi:hypothetical protein